MNTEIRTGANVSSLRNRYAIDKSLKMSRREIKEREYIVAQFDIWLNSTEDSEQKFARRLFCEQLMNKYNRDTSSIDALYLCDFGLSSLPDFKLDCSSFSKLMFREVEIKFDKLINFNKFKSVNLCNNKLEYIKAEWFIYFTGIRELNLSSNKLTRIPTEELSKLGRLTKLNLYDNNISEIEDYAFEGLSIEYIDLRGNKISKIHHNSFSTEDNYLPEINLSDNPINPIDKCILKARYHKYLTL